MPFLSSHLSKFCPKTADFFARSADGQADWQAPLPVTLTAQWEQE